MTEAGSRSIREDLFDAAFLRRVEHLALLARRIVSSGQRAQRRSKKIGSGIEFADHRDYTPGDDLRYLDWSVYGRTERLLLRQYEEEEDLSVYFLIDRSTSMTMAPAGQQALFDRALQVTAALAYISLSNLDRVSVVPFGETVEQPMRPLRGKGQLFRILRRLSDLTPGGGTDLGRALESFATWRPRRGLVVLVSDFYDTDGLQAGLRALAVRGYETLVLQLWDGRMLDAAWWGDLTLVDCETGARHDVCLTPDLMTRYGAAFDDFSAAIEAAARKVGARSLRVDVQVPFDDVVMRVFRTGGFLG